ncbi:MAG: hypothetical protein A3G49_01295 [Candidatus Sungbacteria bacterium RIFCSPLOWO2_12_FULL_41_11]|uniref:NYN domain-containing protein n=1 Tax=Candidatus Sungbacteria bacterium RIFCSPLOWO2_12_FULL_41_11 TaxID=1802286 RepID=A0A1G2LQW4_9BACT|nr:MAG: hypothetical protein UV01_C0006G0016 [Parcubacteria group bacterium GW2011_GWA2_42_14]OGZ97391.1 MAG: hypothetical protein A3D41_05480 [Candidatus Sungbacteria bacterium RIFCSPHIGHO2_02_FULL_41_12b]OHA13269.1 MAG: hypothetical protein A3G49_01295 [Candidatus Sungbacteria bacterium RIFCSPLOWO2_12_FULL_41_11]
MPNKLKKNYAFIDGQNLYLGTRAAGLDLDYKKLRIYLKEKYNVEKAYLFIGYIPENQDLYAELQEQGYLLKFKPVLPARNGMKPKGDIDADLAFSVMRYYKEYDGAVLITSDGDFDTVVRYLRKKSKLSAVISPNKDKCSALLKKAAQDKIQFLEEVGEKILKTNEDVFIVKTENEKAPLGDETQSSAFS